MKYGSREMHFLGYTCNWRDQLSSLNLFEINNLFIHIRMHALYVFIGGRVFYVIVNINMHGGVKMPIFFFNILEINLVENMYGAILSIVDINELNMKWGMIMCFVYKNFRRHRLFYRFLSFFKIKYTLIVSKLITSRNSPNLFFLLRC